MFLQEVINEVKELRRQVKVRHYDKESWHEIEDNLWLRVLKAIATGQCKDAPPEDFAAEAIKTNKIKFDRWCG